METSRADSKFQSINVPLGDRSYPINIAATLQHAIGNCLPSALGDLSHALIIADDAVADPWIPCLHEQLTAVGVNRVDTVKVPSGEPSKSITEFGRLLEWVLESGGDRRSAVFALGGGVVGDLAGYVAASFARGIRFVQIPTTLLAMVDSSVGGKTGINLPGAKNMVGAFWQPSLVAIGTEVLSTLPERSYLSGIAEIIKYGVIDDVEFFHWLEANSQALVERNESALVHAIKASCLSKARVVGADERESTGRRAILNYGHTFAHAIESTAGYGTYLHGEAVAIGMQMAARLAIDLGMCDDELLRRQTKLIQACRLPITFPDASVEAMLPVMMRDKKVAHGKLRFILPHKIGAVDLVGDVDNSLVSKAIEGTR